MKRHLALGRCRLLLVLVAAGTVSLEAQVASLQSTVSLQTVDNITIPFQNGMPMSTFEKQPRPMLNLAGVWRKQRFQADHNLTLKKRDSTSYAALVTEAAGRFLPSYDDSGWETKSLPGVENTMNPVDQRPEYYQNGVWYRRTFPVDDSLVGKFSRLAFLAVNYVADVWLNGTYLGHHEGGYTPFAFDVSSVVRFDTVNVLAVRVDNIPWNPTHVQDPLYDRRIDIVPYYTVDWFNYTGIIHDVYLEFADPVSIVRADVVPLDTEGNLRTTVTVVNRSAADEAVDVTLQVFTAAITPENISTEYTHELLGDAVTITGTSQVTLTVGADSCRAWRTALAVPAPKLWSPHHPNLYILKATVARGGVLLDELVTQFGIRTATTSGNTFLLNGRATFLPGISRHEDHPLYGRSMPTSAIYDDLVKVKSVNAAFLRTAHYPNHPYTYLMTDRLGLAVMEEIPVWWFDTDNAWTIQNLIRRIHVQMWREMVFRDYNRPSIILWSTCNECLVVTGRQTFIAEVNNELDTKYPDLRLVTQSAAADRPGATDPSQAACDVPGWTMYFGIFHGGTYYEGTKTFLDDVHTARPNRPIVDTEFGYWSGENSSEEWKQVQVFDSTFLAFSEHTILDTAGVLKPDGFLMAITWWCVFDWYTSQQAGGYQSMGIYKMDRVTPKQVTPRLINGYAPYYRNSETTGIESEDASGVPQGFRLHQNFPNPFNPETSIRYELPSGSHVTLTVSDLLGREVATLVDADLSAGLHEARWNAAHAATGVYILRLSTGTFRDTKKMLLVR